MEVEKYIDKFVGWQKSLLFYHGFLYSIIPFSSKESGMFPTFSLLNTVIENTTEDKNAFVIKSINNDTQTILKCSTKKQKDTIMKELQEYHDEATIRFALSNEYTTIKREIECQITNYQSNLNPREDEIFEIIKNHYFLSINCMNELNMQLSQLNYEIKDIPTKKKQIIDSKLLNIFYIKDELKSQLDLMMTNIIDYKMKTNSEQLSEKENLYLKQSILGKSQIFYSMIDNEQEYNNMKSLKKSDVESKDNEIFYSAIDYETTSTKNKSIINNNTLKNPNSISINPKEINKTNNIIKSISQVKLSCRKIDFQDPLYNFSKRDYLSKKIKCNKSMSNYISAYEKSTSSSTQIKCYEPISTLQKECERFMYSDLITNATETHNPEIRLCYIIGFIIAQYSLKINRILKSFTPIIGETYEYYDNQKGYRYFAEQVSHNPPISAFIGESDDWAFYGDSREESNFKLLKGAIEIESSNKQHLFLKKTEDYYTFNKPTLNFRGIVVGTLRYNTVGKVSINNSKNSSINGMIEFYDDISKHENGDFEGKVLNNNEVKYLIKGNLNSFSYYCTPDENNKVNIWNIIDDRYINNTFQQYTIPSYSCNFNFYSDKLASRLPPTDTRFRPDIRNREEGDKVKALEQRNQLYQKQNQLLKEYESNNQLYQPIYFYEIYDQNSLDYVYVYKGGYWEDRAKEDYNKLNHNIFILT